MLADEEALIEAPVAELLLDYQVLSNGEPIGRLRTERRRGWLDDLPVLQVSNRMDLRCSGLWFDYSLQSDESMDFGADGLCRYAGVSDEDGDKTVIKGRLRQGVLTLRLHDGQLEVRRFKQGDFDASSEDAAERFLAGGQAEATLRVLDLEHFDIDEVRYQRRRTKRWTCWASRGRRGWWPINQSGARSAAPAGICPTTAAKCWCARAAANAATTTK